MRGRVRVVWPRVRVRVRARVRARVGSSWASTSSSEVGMATPMKSVRWVHSHLVRARLGARLEARLRVGLGLG